LHAQPFKRIKRGDTAAAAVTPAKAGVQHRHAILTEIFLDSGLRRNDALF